MTSDIEQIQKVVVRVKYQSNEVEITRNSSLTFQDLDQWVRQRFQIGLHAQLAYYSSSLDQKGSESSLGS